MMPRYQWSSTFEVCVPEIDGDHRVMLELINKIVDTAHTGDKQRCIVYINRLIEFSLMHFSREEQLLDSWGYGETDAHRQYHVKMHQNAVNHFGKLDAVQGNDALASFCNELLSFLVDDVVGGDLNLKSFLIHQGITIEHDDATPAS